MAKRISDAAILAQIPAARARERAARRDGLRATGACYQRARERLVIDLANGVQFAMPTALLPQLRALSATQRAAVRVDPSGAALRWDAADIDLSVAGLILSVIGPKEQARQLARIAGSITTPAKASASRRNGAKGGRPRKVLVPSAGAAVPESSPSRRH